MIFIGHAYVSELESNLTAQRVFITLVIVPGSSANLVFTITLSLTDREDLISLDRAVLLSLIAWVYVTDILF